MTANAITPTWHTIVKNKYHSLIDMCIYRYWRLWHTLNGVNERSMRPTTTIEVNRQCSMLFCLLLHASLQTYKQTQ